MDQTKWLVFRMIHGARILDPTQFQDVSSIYMSCPCHKFSYEDNLGGIPNDPTCPKSLNKATKQKKTDKFVDRTFPLFFFLTLTKKLKKNTSCFRVFGDLATKKIQRLPMGAFLEAQQVLLHTGKTCFDRLGVKQSGSFWLGLILLCVGCFYRKGILGKLLQANRPEML